MICADRLGSNVVQKTNAVARSQCNRLKGCHNTGMSDAPIAARGAARTGTPATPDTALLVVNLGTPEHPTAAAVGRYLVEFLGDPYVVPLHPWVWKPLLHGIISPLRRGKSAAKYQQVWMPEGSPLAVYTQRLTHALAAQLPQWRVMMAMRYGKPALQQQLDALHAAGCSNIVVLPLYPQYSTTTTATVLRQIQLWQQQHRTTAVHVIKDYADDPLWIRAVADSISTYWQKHGRAQRLVFSFHGLPQRLVEKGDPYPQRCQTSTTAIASALHLKQTQWQLTYQSRFGRQAWLQPDTETQLWQLAESGVKTIDIVCPGFAVDCLETLEEIALRFADSVAARGAQLRYIPCLNDDLAHARALAALARNCPHLAISR